MNSFEARDGILGQFLGLRERRRKIICEQQFLLMCTTEEVLKEHRDVGASSSTDLLEMRAFSKSCQSTIEILTSMALHLHTQP